MSHCIVQYAKYEAKNYCHGNNTGFDRPQSPVQMPERHELRGKIMNNIHFPNTSRSFDASKNRVCFWGYDRTIELSFFVGFDALKQISSEVGTAEMELLGVFDAAIDKIHKAAARAYANGSRSHGRFSYVLTAEDF